MLARHPPAKHALRALTVRHFPGEKLIATLRPVQVCVKMDYALRDRLKLSNAHLENILTNLINTSYHPVRAALLVLTALQAQ